MSRALCRARRRVGATAAAFDLSLTVMVACAPDVVEADSFSRGDGPRAAQGNGPADASTLQGDGRAPSGNGAGEVAVDAISPADAGGVGRAQDPACDLNGVWLVAQRELAVAIGQEQAAHNWFYYEVHQDGAELSVTKGLHCGYEVIAKTSLAANVDSSGAWSAFLTHNSSAGRKGSFVQEGASCHLVLDRQYVVRGATLPYYLDPTIPLPGPNEAANGTVPGWEDWDQDGHPGISLKVTSPLASGTLYTCQRDWTAYDGLTPTAAGKFKVSMTYNGEQLSLGRSPGSAQALESSSSPSSGADAHYAWFYRLSPGQVSGSDEAICAAIRSLKDTLVPEAAE
jgi:hypothetical protein